MLPDHSLAQRLVSGLALFAIVAFTLAVKFWQKKREESDPALAARMERIRNHMQKPGSLWGWEFAANRMIWVAGAVGVVAANAAVEKYAPQMHWSDRQKIEILLAVMVGLAVAGIVVNRLINRWLRARGLIRTA